MVSLIISLLLEKMSLIVSTFKECHFISKLTTTYAKSHNKEKIASIPSDSWGAIYETHEIKQYIVYMEFITFVKWCKWTHILFIPTKLC